MPKVYIPNQNLNDYSNAERWGDLVYVTQGHIRLTDIDDILGSVDELLDDSEPGDYIIMAGPYSITAILCTVFALKHNCLNILIYVNGKYVERKLDLSSVC